jgi:glucosyl-dolichyl phosphate glucuronosyltransferase
MTAAPRVSVIIATYNRAALLDECLAHIRSQRFAAGDEIIVVDNGSTDATAAVVARHQRACTTPVRLLQQPRPGKSHAIALALGVAAGDLLVFTDDDVDVGAAWLEAIRTAMSDRAIAMVGGPVAARWDSAVAHWFRAAVTRQPRLGAPLGLLDYGDQRVNLGERTLLGANLAVRRDVFTAVGGYPTHLGKLRGTLLSGEDHELCRRVQASGYRAVYVPEAVVYHWVPAQRARVGYSLDWFFWSGITHAIMDEGQARAGRALAGLPLYLVRRAASASAGVVAALLTARGTLALTRALEVAFAAGYAAQRWGVVNRATAAPAPVGEPA